MKGWSYFDKFRTVVDEYLPDMGEGETVATQTVTAVNRLIYKWYNDGDVYDNVNSPMTGWCNDLSDQANWLALMGHKLILDRIFCCYSDGDYEDILADLADEALDEKALLAMSAIPKVGSIYDCKGSYEYSDFDYEDDEEDCW